MKKTEIKPDRLKKIAGTIHERLEGEIMTTAEKLIASGIEKGRIEGERKGKLEAARNLLSLNVPLETVLKATGLSLDDLKKAGIIK